jgi:hypothetical protein
MTKIATRLTDAARRETRAFLERWLEDGVNLDAFMNEIEVGGNHGVNPEYGLNYELSARYTKSGNPIPFNIPASDFVWADAENP